MRPITETPTPTNNQCNVSHLQAGDQQEPPPAQQSDLGYSGAPADQSQQGHDEQGAQARQSEPPIIWLNDAEPCITDSGIVRGVILAETMIVSYGESNSGKTFHVMDRDIRMACGMDYYGRETEGGIVLYVAAEGAYGIKNRAYAYRIENDITDAPFAIYPGAIDLLHPDADVMQLIDWMKRIEDKRGKGCIKVTADTLARVMNGGNENSPQDMGQLIGNADVIRRELGCAFEFVHHSGKDAAKGARGHSSLRAATDTEIEVTSNDGLHIAVVTKQRDLPSGQEFAYKLKIIELGKDKHGYPVTTCVPEWELDASVKKDIVTKTKSESRAMSAIHKCFSEVKILPTSDVFKANQKTLKVGQYIMSASHLAKYVVNNHSVSDSDNADTQARQLRRALGSLRDKGFIRLYKDWLWLTDIPDIGGHL